MKLSRAWKAVAKRSSADLRHMRYEAARQWNRYLQTRNAAYRMEALLHTMRGHITDYQKREDFDATLQEFRKKHRPDGGW